MTLIALLLALPAFAGDRSDASRVDTHDRADRSEASDRADTGRSRSTAERAHADRGGNGHHVRARHASASRHVRAHAHRPAHRVHSVHAPPRHHPRVVVHAAPPPPAAERAPAKVRRPEQVDHSASVMVNVVDVPAPLFTASAEVALGRKVGLLGSGGVGFSELGALYEVGADARLYALGDFDRGLFVGGGAGVTNISPFAMNDRAFTVEGFVGGKYATNIGLTGEFTVGAEAANHAEIGGLYPKVTLGLGWSF